MQHPEEGTIHAWLDGALPASEAAALESHVASCADCAAAVADARGMIAASSRIVGHLDAVPGNVIPAAPKRRVTSWRNPWFAAVAAGLILFVGYRNRATSRDASVLEEMAQSPTVVRQPTTDSSVVVLPAPPRIEPQRSVGASKGVVVGTLPDSAVLPALPPANATAQKSSAPSAPPVAARRLAEEEARARDTRFRARSLELSEVVITGTADRGKAASTATGAAAAARNPAAPTTAAAPSVFSRAEVQAQTSAYAFTGCYEMNASTDVLPVRFALGDSAVTPGLMAISYVDSDGRPSTRIADVGWALEGDQVVVKTLARETLLTLRKTGSVVTGEGRSGSRNGRVTSCTR